MITHPTKTVFTGDEWLLQIFDGYTDGVDKIEVVRDALNRPIISKAIANDVAWNLNILVTNPITQETKPLIQWFTEIPFVYNPENE